MDFLKELWVFLRVRKKLWLAPIILVMLILGARIHFMWLVVVVLAFIHIISIRKGPKCNTALLIGFFNKFT